MYATLMREAVDEMLGFVLRILPHLLFKTRQHRIRVFDVLLRLLPHVENGTIFTCAQNILMHPTYTILVQTCV